MLMFYTTVTINSHSTKIIEHGVDDCVELTVDYIRKGGLNCTCMTSNPHGTAKA